MAVIFGNPGSTELPFLRDMPKDFKYVLALHERSAAGAALGYAMGRGEAAFVNLHSIASVGNGLSAIIDAHYCHAPLVITTGQQDRRHLMAEPFLSSRAVEVVKPYVKWAYEPLRGQDVPAAIAHGYYLAMQAPMGPVFISIPMDDWMQQTDEIAGARCDQNCHAGCERAEWSGECVGCEQESRDRRRPSNRGRWGVGRSHRAGRAS